MQRPRLRPKNLGKKKKTSKKPKLRPAGLGATKKEIEAMERGFRINEMEGREREEMKNMKGGGKLNMVKGPKGTMVPDYAADGVGKLSYGGKAKVKKMNYGGKAKVKKMGYGGEVKKMSPGGKTDGGGMCRGMGAAIRGGGFKMG